MAKGKSKSEVREGGSRLLLFLSELDDQCWVVTGLATDIEAELESNSKIRLQSRDEELSRMFKAHQAALKKAKQRPAAALKSADEAVTAFARFLTVAFEAS